MKERVAEHAKKHASLEWFVGVGWDQDIMRSNGLYPTRFDIDEVVSKRPVFLYRGCWHIGERL
jgi:predicted amidohydrolase YtcJ